MAFLFKRLIFPQYRKRAPRFNEEYYINICIYIYSRRNHTLKLRPKPSWGIYSYDRNFFFYFDSSLDVFIPLSLKCCCFESLIGSELASLFISFVVLITGHSKRNSVLESAKLQPKLSTKLKRSDILMVKRGVRIWSTKHDERCNVQTMLRGGETESVLPLPRWTLDSVLLNVGYWRILRIAPVLP